MILNLISGPRNVSMAFMYSFAQRSDTEVVDEPFYAVYLAKTGAAHPGAAEVLQALPADEERVKEKLAAPRDKPVLFLKNMAHHLEVLREPLLPEWTNIFLIREPAQVLSSYTRVIAQPAMRDIGLACQYALFRELQRRGRKCVVIDSALLLADPPGVLRKLCLHCRLPFEQRMTHWKAGPKPYDGVWAPYWYANVHHSTGFDKPRTGSRPLPSHLKGLLDEAMSFYEKLLPFALKA